MLRSYVLIMFITFVEQAVGLTILGVEYSLLIAMAIAVFDILPVVGSGTIMLPWAVISLVTGDTRRGVGLLVLYVIITVIRQIIEPRIVGEHVGLHPMLTLMCMFVGLRVFGGLGLLGLPILCAVLVGLEPCSPIGTFPCPRTRNGRKSAFCSKISRKSCKIYRLVIRMLQFVRIWVVYCLHTIRVRPMMQR